MVSANLGIATQINLMLPCYSLIEGPKAALIASKDFHDGHYTSTPEIGLRAFARAYSTWSYGQTVRAIVAFRIRDTEE